MNFTSSDLQGSKTIEQRGKDAPMGSEDGNARCLNRKSPDITVSALRRISKEEKMQESSRFVFCGKTALEITHFLNDTNLPRIRTSLTRLPVHAPSDAELRNALAKLSLTGASKNIDFPAHLLFQNDVHHRKTAFRIPHRCTNLPKGRSFLKLGQNAFAASPNFALCELADETQNLLELLLLLWEALGRYRTRLTWMDASYETAPITSLRSLTRFVTDNPHLHGAAKIAQALRYVREGSASVRESQIALFMGLPLRYGGFNLGLPQMNYRVEASREARIISGRSHFRCDLCWPDQKVDVEYQSDEMHEGRRMRIRDSRRTNALITMGWNVICITNSEAQNLSTLEQIAERIRKLIRKRSHPSTRELNIKRLLLHRSLGIIDDGLHL